MEQYSPEQLHMIKQLRALKSTGVDFAYLKSLRAELLTRVAYEQPHRMIFVWHTALRFATRAIVAVVGIGVLGFGVVFASQYVSPQSFLYPIKLATEQAQIALGGNESGVKADLRVRFASIRLEEIQSLDQSNQLETASVQKALVQYEQHLRDMQDDLAYITSDDAAKTLEQLLALETSMQELMARYAAVNTTIQTKLQDVSLREQASTAEQTSALTQETIQRTIVDFEADRGTVAGDQQKGVHTSLMGTYAQKQYDQIWGVFMGKVQVDAREEMRILSEIHTTIAPGKGVSDIPDKDWDTYVVLLGVKQRIARLQAIDRTGMQSLSDAHYLDIVKEYKDIRAILGHIELSLRTQ